MTEKSVVRLDRSKRPRLGGDITTVLVGPEATATRFFVRADLASQHSDFFQACLKKGWKEAEERIVRLPDLPEISARAFEDFHSFLYTGKVYSAAKDEENDPEGDDEWVRLVDAWILGAVLLSVPFKDAVVDAIIHKLTSTDWYQWLRLMVDIAVHGWNENAMKRGGNDSDMSLFRGISVAFLNDKNQHETAKRSTDPCKQRLPCFYHEHGDKPCYKAMF